MGPRSSLPDQTFLLFFCNQREIYLWDIEKKVGFKLNEIDPSHSAEADVRFDYGEYNVETSPFLLTWNGIFFTDQ